MAKVLWQINFKSLNGTSCRVDIYDPTVPEETPISPMVYTGAEDPFYIEEDNSDDLLNGVVRYSTGYIRMIDNGNSYLQDIYPSSVFDRPVKAYYGSTLIFNGYIQVQDFVNEQVPTPKVIELPVISQLGLFDQRNFHLLNGQPPALKTLKELLNTALSGRYSYIYFPNDNGTGGYGYPSPIDMGMQILSLAVCPWNEDFHHSMLYGSLYKVMKPESYMYLIECICKAFGWICHETPDALVFSCFDWSGSYVYYPVGHIGESDYRNVSDIPSSASDLTDFFTAADDGANVKTIQPDTGIEISYDGSLGTGDFSYQRTLFNSVEKPDTDETREQYTFCNLAAITSLHEIDNAGSLSFNDQGLINSGVGCVAWNGNEGLLISIGSNWANNRKLFTLRFYTKTLGRLTYNVKYDIMTSPNGHLYELESVDELRNVTANEYTIQDNYVSIIFRYRYGGSFPSALADKYLVFIHNVRLELDDNGEPYAEYQITPSSSSDYIPEPSGSDIPVISSSITMPLSLYRLNDNLIGTSVRASKLTEYPYLFQKRQELVSKFKVVSAPTVPYARKFSHLSKNWRMIAQTFHPWNDEVTLTMQSSPILND
jgi:hypothetical protein